MLCRSHHRNEDPAKVSSASPTVPQRTACLHLHFFQRFLPASTGPVQPAARLRWPAHQCRTRPVQRRPVRLQRQPLLLLDQKDGVRLLKTDANATNVLAQTLLGAKGDIGLAMTLDPAGNVYIMGTSTSGTLAATAGVAFPSPADTSTNSFVAKFDASLNPIFVTYTGSGRMAAAGIAATANAPSTSPAASSPPRCPLRQPESCKRPPAEAPRTASLRSSTLPAQLCSTRPISPDTAATPHPPPSRSTPPETPTSPGQPQPPAIPPWPRSFHRSCPQPQAAQQRISYPAHAPTATASPSPPSSPAAESPRWPTTPIAQNLLLSGSIALGQFPIASVSMPLIGTAYQSLLRMSLDGSTVLNATLIAPGTQSFVAPTSSRRGLDQRRSFDLAAAIAYSLHHR